LLFGNECLGQLGPLGCTRGSPGCTARCMRESPLALLCLAHLGPPANQQAQAQPDRQVQWFGYVCDGLAHHGDAAVGAWSQHLHVHLPALVLHLWRLPCDSRLWCLTEISWTDSPDGWLTSEHFVCEHSRDMLHDGAGWSHLPSEPHVRVCSPNGCKRRNGASKGTMSDNQSDRLPSVFLLLTTQLTKLPTEPT
jgi:hypothetical protein